MENDKLEKQVEVEKVSSFESYVIENGVRTKRVCGRQRKNKPKGIVCLHPAGAHTVHPGYGQCSLHDNSITNSNRTNVWALLNIEAGLPSTLKEVFENAQLIDDIHLSEVDDDIKMMYALVGDIVHKGEEVPLTSRDIDRVMGILGKIIKAKETRAKLNKEVKLDATTVKEFVNQIFEVVISLAPKDTARRILVQIMDEVIAPFKTAGRITGDEFDYQIEDADFKEKE